MTHSFNITGLSIGNRFYDPCATCDLLQQIGWIEDFAIDANGEPVILFTKDCEDENGNWHNLSGYELWCDFVKSFFFSERVAEMVLDYIASTKQFQKAMQTIDHLQNVAA